MKYLAVVLEVGGVVLIVVGATTGLTDLIGVGVGSIILGWGCGLASCR